MSPPVLAEPPELAVLPLWEEAGGRSPLRPVEPAPAAPDDCGGPSGAGRAAGTLEAAVADSWRTLRSGFASECLVCGGAVLPRWSASAGVVGGRCDSCGTAVE